MAFASRNSLGRQLRSIFYDPFSGVHHYWNWFDAVLLTPYFIVMIVLALYGMHRYTLCWQYFKH
ncbi:MAG: glycosyl transferase family 2, partial [Terracidiphilus sp.]